MKHFIGVLLLFTSHCLFSQYTAPFAQEVERITQQTDALWDNTKATVLFTGSSSVRLWKDLQERFPNQQVLNTGFGGSQAYDLNYHLEDLVLRYSPRKVFIYEGDNDIFSKKKPKNIILTLGQIMDRIKTQLPNTQIVLISAKPSIARWKLRRKYKKLNKLMAHYAKNTQGVQFADVWQPMLLGRKLNKGIFISDGLHMNQKGYEIWYQSLKAFMP